MILFDDMFVDALDGFTTYAAAQTNTVLASEATPGRGALPTRFCKSCRKALDVFRDFDGELKTCRLCLRVRKKDAKRKRASATKASATKATQRKPRTNSLEHWNGAFFVANPRSPSLPP